MSSAAAVPAIALDAVSFAYPARRGHPRQAALDQISLCIAEGQSVAMLGPNGSGKSTLLRIICGLLEPQAGRVSVFGSSAMSKIRSRLGVVFQSPALDRQLRVIENLRDQAALFGVRGSKASQRIARELEDAGLSDRSRSMVKTLSGGLVRRVDLIRALLHDPPLLLLDEPTAGLDPGAREQFLQSVEARRAARALTVLLNTHLVDEADRCDRVVLMHRGRIVADDSPQALRRRLGAMRVTVAADSGSRPVQPPRIIGLQWARASGGWVTSLGDDDQLARRVAAELAGSGLSFSIAPPTLADLFEQLTGEGLVNDSGAAAQPSRSSRKSRAPVSVT